MRPSNTIPSNAGISLASRPSCLGKLGSVLAIFVNFYHHLCQALETLPYEYESPRKFLGLPLLSINLGFDNPHGKMRRARGLLAIGNQATGLMAFGVFMACGIFTIAPVATGVVAVSIFGLAFLSISVVGFGLVSVSVFAVGYLAVGILALGYKGVGIVAFGQDVVGIIGIGQRVRAVFSL
jgi:hypothetical protein